MKKQIIIVIAAVILVFLLTITAYQHMHNRGIRKELQGYSQLMADAMWKLDQAELQQRLQEIAKIQNYDEVRLLHADSSEFLGLRKSRLRDNSARQLARNFGMLQGRSYYIPIDYRGRTLGYLTVTTTGNTGVVQLYLAVLLALIGLAIIYHLNERRNQRFLIKANIRLLREVDERKRIVRALQESEELRLSLLQNLPIGVFLVSLDLHVLTMNRKMQQWYPDVEPMQHMKCYQCMHGDDTTVPCEDCPTQKTLADGNAHEAILTVTRNGQSRKLRIMSAPVHNDHREIIAATVMVDDITEGLELEERLRQAERRQAEQEIARFKEILDNTTELAAVINPDGQLRYLNRAGYRLLGVAPGEPLPDLQAADLHEPEVAEDIQERAFSIARKKGVWSGESLFRRYDGVSIPMLQVMIAHRGNDGELEYFSTIGTDISAIRQASRALQHSEQRLRAIFQSATVGIVLIDSTGKYVDFNPTWEQMIGYSRSDLLHMGPLDVTLPDDHNFGVDTIRRAMIAGHSYRSEKRYVRRDGSIFWAELSTSLIASTDSNEKLLLGVITDINERIKAETRIRSINEELEMRVRDRTVELETVNRELEAFCYSVSHDLRAPLRGINGFCHVLKSDYEQHLDETGLDYLSRIQRAAIHMSTLIDGLLNLSRLSRREMLAEPVNLTDIAQDIVRELRQQNPERKVSIAIQPDITCPQGDPRLLQNTLQNLLGNAWKFTRNTADAQICFGGQPEPEGMVYFVKDNGVGFDMDYESKLFTPFQRLHSQDEFEGSGIGLASVQRIVRRHGGRIWAEGAPGQGAAFFFTLQGMTESGRNPLCKNSI